MCIYICIYLIGPHLCTIGSLMVRPSLATRSMKPVPQPPRGHSHVTRASSQLASASKRHHPRIQPGSVLYGSHTHTHQPGWLKRKAPLPCPKETTIGRRCKRSGLTLKPSRKCRSSCIYFFRWFLRYNSPRYR